MSDRDVKSNIDGDTNNMNTITAVKLLSDEEIQMREGEHFSHDHYKISITSDTDVYKPDGTILLRFRKNVIDPCYTKPAMESLRKVSMKRHDNRGAPAGPLDWNRMPNYVGEWFKTFKFRTHYVRKSNQQKSKHDISNLSPSNVIGYFDRKDRNDPLGLPCRLTAFSKQETDKWNNTIPLIQQVAQQFKKLMPVEYSRQLNRANLSQDFIIKDTCFSTITVNYSWRTACHRDKGDYQDGFGNIIVCEDGDNPNKYRGCCTGFPQYGVCVDVREGDFLAMDVHEWHCNTEFVQLEPTKPYLSFKERDINNSWHFNRLSMVCYLRNNMHKCTERIEMTKNQYKLKEVADK